MPLLAAAIGLALFMLPGSASAGGLILTQAGVGSSEPAAMDATLIELADLAVVVGLSDNRAQVTETRTYRMNAPLPLDGVELTSGNATVVFYRSLLGGSDTDSVELSLNGIVIGGEVLGAQAADERRLQLLVDMANPGVLRELGVPMFVSEPIDVGFDTWGAAVTLELTTDQPLVPWDTMGAVTVPLDWGHEKISSLNVTIEADTEEQLRNLYSPYHGLTVERLGANSATATHFGSRVNSSLPLTILMSTGSDMFHVDLLPYRVDDVEGGFFMALLAPPPVLAEADAIVPRDLVFVIDTSGSMDGEKIRQARDALTEVLGGLGSRDTFAVVTFDSVIESFGDSAVEANSAQINDAQTYVAGLYADGGTNLYGALERGFDMLPTDPNHLRYIVLLTDGQPTEGNTDIEEILAMTTRRNEVRARIFTFGIGSDVNTVLLDRLASESSGDALYIRPGENVQTAVSAFFDQISAPVLADPRVNMSAFGTHSTYPADLPDLFAGQTVNFMGRYDTPGRAELVLYGIRGGEDEAVIYDVNLPAFNSRNGHVPRVWATRHVGNLFQLVKLGNEDPTVVDEAMLYADRYGVVTEFSYYAFDEFGNYGLIYNPVPDDQVGDVAVETSESLDGYQNSGSVGDADDSGQLAGPASPETELRYEFGYLRYHSDRTLPSVDAYYTDTALPPAPQWVDVHFGSDAYFAFLSTETSRGIGGFASLGRNLRFVFLGRHIRITNPLDPAHGADLIGEATVPPPVLPEGVTTATDAPATVVRTRTLQGVDAIEAANAGVTTLDEPDPAPTGCACQQGPAEAPMTWGLVLGALCLVLVSRRRIRQTSAR